MKEVLNDIYSLKPIKLNTGSWANNINYIIYKIDLSILLYLYFVKSIKSKAVKSCKYVKWYKKSLNYNFKRSYSRGRKDKNRDMAGLNFKRQLCH